jgi:dipeptidase E
MKLLLTSAGLTNKTIADGLASLVGKSAGDTKIALIPTAALAEEGNKDWFVGQFLKLYTAGYTWVDMVDPSAPNIDWEFRLQEVDVVFVSGGNTFHLLDQWRKTGFGEWVGEHLDGKVYVGVSAGAIIAAPTIEVATIEPADRNIVGLKNLTGMGWVDFEIEPHCEGERYDVIKKYAEAKQKSVYAIDDTSAILVNDGEVKVLSEGRTELYGG